jgi:hypothetical protein
MILMNGISLGKENNISNYYLRFYSEEKESNNGHNDTKDG